MLGAALGVIAATALAVAPVQAAPAAAESTASVADRLVLEPTERGYRGSLEAEVTYQGSEPGRARYVITEPVPHSYVNLEWGISCYSGGTALPDGRIRVECDVPGGELQPGERRAFTIDFEVLTKVQPYAMKAVNGRLAVKVDGTTVTNESFRTRFRSSTGSLRDPQPYVRDTESDATLTSVGDLTLVRQPDGDFVGRLPVRVRYNGDAPHWNLNFVTSGLPEGVYESYTDPADGCAHFCVPGGQFMEDEERDFDVIFLAPAGTPLGDLGEAGLEVQVDWGNRADANPADNAGSFSVTAVDAA
ncbi:hypothetical protein [Micromonospora endolithica]|uniref:hypothetical protein n=1 Tax=Micromonospora endolithica TaxID=230091 RepID=UPI0011BE3405|nr:hypothetical protein [Micromonospora endolithica]